MNKRIFGWSIIVLCAVCGIANAELRLANIFNDHMVLQQEKPLTIWGWAQPGQSVKITLTENRGDAIAAVGEKAFAREQVESKKEPEGPQVTIQYVQHNASPFMTITKTVKVGGNGRWSVKLDPLKASFVPKYLCVASGDEKVGIFDLLVGEVWVTAGQSNMYYGGDKTGWLDKQSLQLPGVRYVHTGRYSSYKPKDDLAERVQWTPATGELARNWSTVPYLFAKYLHGQLKVPVGVINAASGGAFGNYWCSPDRLRAIDFWAVKQLCAEEDAVINAWENPNSRKKVLADHQAKFDEQMKQWETEAAAAREAKKREPKKPEFRPMTGPQVPHKLSYLYNARIVPIGPLAVRGALYLQGEQQVLGWAVSRYEYIFPQIIPSFRDAFGDKDMPFGIITLQGAGHNKIQITEVGAVDRTAMVRDIHYRTHLNTPNTGFICAHDVGRGLHPSWKRPLAERAVHWALRDVYQTINDNSYRVEKIEYKKGAAYVHMASVAYKYEKVKGEQVRTKTTRKVGFAPWSGNDSQYYGGFLIAGKDKRWYPAKVRGLNEKEDGVAGLLVWSDLVPEPVALRYGWASYPVANIGPWENPLPPFRTDDWPLVDSFSVKSELQQKNRSDWYDLMYGGYDNLLDRMIHQGRFDGAKGEMLLYGKAPLILKSKADRIDAILDEIDPQFYQNDKLRELDFSDWTIRKANERALQRSTELQNQMQDVANNKALQKNIDAVRKAVDEYRKAVEELDKQ